MESPTPRAINIAVSVQTMDRAGSAEERPERVVYGYPPDDKVSTNFSNELTNYFFHEQ